MSKTIAGIWLKFIHQINELFVRSSAYRISYFQIAAAAGHVEEVKYILSKEDVSKVLGKSLKLAVSNDQVEVVKLLLENGANNDDAFKIAVSHNKINTVQVFLKHDPNIHTIDNNYALGVAAIQGYFELITILLDHGADLHANNEEPLRHASDYGHIDIVKLLIERGANASAIDNEPLIFAASNGHFNVVHYLVDECKADIHTNNNEALRVAAKNKYDKGMVYKSIVKGTIQYNQQTVAQYNQAAEQLEQAEALVKYLVDNGADINNAIEHCNYRHTKNVLRKYIKN